MCQTTRPTLSESSPPGTGWCDSVISTTFVMLRFPNQCASTPSTPPSNSLKSCWEGTTWWVVCSTWFRLQPGCTLVFGEALYTQLLKGQIISMSGVKGMKILPLLCQFCIPRVTWVLFPFANAWFCLVMCLLMRRWLCESQEAGKRWDSVSIPLLRI